MTFYGELDQPAQEMIAEFGRDFVLRHTTATYNATTNVLTETVTDTTVKGVMTEFKQNEIDGTLILRGDKRVLLASTLEPQQNDVLIDGGKQYTVVEIMAIQPGDTVLLYKVQVRA